VPPPSPARAAPLSPEATRTAFKQLCDAIAADEAIHQAWDRLDQWVGTVQAVQTKLLGGQQVLINLDPPGAGTSHAIEFDVDAGAARELVPGQTVVFSGTVNTYSRTTIIRQPPCTVELTDTTFRMLER
jgi:hypothetical protein